MTKELTPTQAERFSLELLEVADLLKARGQYTLARGFEAISESRTALADLLDLMEVTKAARQVEA